MSPSASPSAGYEVYSRGDELNLPANDTDLETSYNAQDYLDVDTNNEVRVDQTATQQYMIHQFKDWTGTNPKCHLKWEGKSTLAPLTSPVVLQIYNRSGVPAWEEIDTDDTSSADADFLLEADIPDLTDYKDANSVISCRIYQLAL